MTYKIETDRLSKSYGKVMALREVSLRVSEGELFGLIGPDGAGKSTLYSILTTLLPPDSGSASVAGFDTTKEYRKIRRSIGYMPQKFSLYPDLSVEENLNFFSALFGVDRRASEDIIGPAFSQLKKFMSRRASALSGGMKQKLALCCALIHRPEVLLLDEPTTGVDAVSRSEFWDILHTLCLKGITIMVSTSYMDEAQLCHRIALINKGKILKTDAPAKLVGSLGENLWAAAAPDMYALLEALRKTPMVKECYTFGATIHIVAADDFNPNVVEKALRHDGIHHVSLHPAKGTIEDLFIKLMQNGE